MSVWTPSSIYESKPWLMIVLGAILGVGTMLWSLSAGLWTVSRSLMCLLGVALAIAGGATLQLRQDYRARSKWRRDKSA